MTLEMRRPGRIGVERPRATNFGEAYSPLRNVGIDADA